MPPRDAEVAPTPADARPPDVDAMLARHLSTLHAFVRLRAGPALLRHESSADLAQSVCRELLRRRDRFRYGGEPEFRRWLFTTAARKIAKRRAYHRAEKRDAARRSPLSPGESPQADDAVLLDAYRAISTPSAKLAAGEQVARIEAALAKLSEERREI
ncbi:MAG TPA: sigma factor, partial [Planctomycetota bacterium]|nr:sigma factor [Planctomycetota bacterium]